MLVADLEVAVEGSFDPAVEALGKAAEVLRAAPGSAVLLEVLALQAVYAAVSEAWNGHIVQQSSESPELKLLLRKLGQTHDLVVGGEQTPGETVSGLLGGLPSLATLLRGLEI